MASPRHKKPQGGKPCGRVLKTYIITPVYRAMNIEPPLLPMVCQFPIKDDLKAAGKTATEAYRQYDEVPMTSQQREGFDMELALL